MSIPAHAIEWLREKVEEHAWVGVSEARSTTHFWRKSTGGRIMSAGLTAIVIPSAEFSIVVDAPGVSPEYAAAAKNGVLSVLLSQSWSPILACSVTLSAFHVHPEDSCYAAFYSVAEEATLQLLGLAPGFSHNIKW